MLKNYIRHRMADQKIDDITELIERSGVSRNSINKLFRGSNVETLKLDTLMRLCDALHCNLSDLVEYKYEK
ncbi:helix-turn-helix domain-containing protein [Anaeromassilibacillus senegalensis]|uniref:helix-turn-helix domain-containing protein n=1 Tax=Anaeromassilibacillus senegalensis TaxID=1673717 RepID=UPI00067FFCEE|nr:helix-turn-helix transcriptional regulator [Anaeromassilibacillus senegalensis]